jgi:hypothetical protein
MSLLLKLIHNDEIVRIFINYSSIIFFSFSFASSLVRTFVEMGMNSLIIESESKNSFGWMFWVNYCCAIFIDIGCD